MKIAAIIVRILMGLIFAFASITVLFHLMKEPELTGNVKIFMEGMMATGYMMTVVKIFELACAISFLSGKFVPLATVVIFPIILNILLFHSFLDPSGLPIAILLMAGNLFLAWYHREKYSLILKP